MFNQVFGEDSPVLAMLRRRQRCRHRGRLQRQEDCLITEEDYICDACNQLAMQYVNSRLSGEPSASSSHGTKQIK
ncbi:unnamed protein product [Leptidea sinapis]|uniref:ClpX-type ZB domain-containing protein n=1 Tax=Leptidea sinapis TaxID=189913 RepID=A0A5E4QR87_9NEOP|nr:unnamed protein product [Leptidea sinapis]